MQYQLTRRLGRGGMADVFLAIRRNPRGRPELVVLKKMFPELAADPAFVAMFLEEGRLASRVRHANVVRILDTLCDGEPCVAMEYLSGETLSYLVDAARLPFPIAARIAMDAASGLQAVHDCDIVHRDVSPRNLLTCYDGTTRLLDFGIATTSADPDTLPGTFRGTLAYMAPEQTQGVPMDARTDVFQLGVVLHELLTGRRLFAATSDHTTYMAALHQPIPAPSALAPAVPPELDGCVMRALERNRDRRTPTAARMRVELEDALARTDTETAHAHVAAWLAAAIEPRIVERRVAERYALSDPPPPGKPVPPLIAGEKPARRTTPQTITVTDQPAAVASRAGGLDGIDRTMA